jgi:hypothetical protein
MAKGGYALAGYVVNAHYFVGDHGVYHEVSQGWWEWSRLHAISAAAGLLLIGAGSLLLRYIARRRDHSSQHQA